jgi:hypothetical protein
LGSASNFTAGTSSVKTELRHECNGVCVDDCSVGMTLDVHLSRRKVQIGASERADRNQSRMSGRRKLAALVVPRLPRSGEDTVKRAAGERLGHRLTVMGLRCGGYIGGCLEP